MLLLQSRSNFFFQIAEWKTLLLLCDQFFIARCVCCVNVGGKKACGKITNTSSIITLCLGEAKNNIKLPRSKYFYGRSSWRSHYLFMGSENWLFLDAYRPPTASITTPRLCLLLLNRMKHAKRSIIMSSCRLLRHRTVNSKW